MPGSPQYIVNFILCNIIVTEELVFLVEQRIITLLLSMDPTPQDIKIVWSSLFVPCCNSSIPVPTSLQEMPAYCTDLLLACLRSMEEIGSHREREDRKKDLENSDLKFLS